MPNLINRQLNRRQFMKTVAVGGSAVTLTGLFGCTTEPTASTTTFNELVIAGPPAPPSILLARLAEQDSLKSLVPQVSFSVWKNPDQLRANAASGRYHGAETPSNVAAVLYQRGLPIQLLNINVWGLLYVLSAEESVNSWDTLHGQTIAVPFKGDMPDLVFRYLAEQNGANPDHDFDLQYVATPVEAMQLLASGQVKQAVLPDPIATGAQAQGKENGLSIKRVLNLREEWGQVTGRAPRIPQAGMFVTKDLVKNQPELVEAIQTGLKDAVAWTKENPAEAAKLGAEHLGLKAPLIEKALPNIALELVPAAEARDDLEFFYTQLKTMSPDLIGGDLPDDSFYYANQVT